jgi:DNA (cytosine-5)-methyltransferase 1
METSALFIPGNEREALQWLIPALDRPLANMPMDEFLKAWHAISYLFGGLNPDEATNHGVEVANDHDGPERFQLIEPRLVGPYYVQSGWPLVLAPMTA